MNNESEERWHCMNPECRKELIVGPSSSPQHGNPRCACGAEMKKDYHSPVFRYLEFLRLEDPVLSERTPLKE